MALVGLAEVTWEVSGAVTWEALAQVMAFMAATAFMAAVTDSTGEATDSMADMATGAATAATGATMATGVIMAIGAATATGGTTATGVTIGTIGIIMDGTAAGGTRGRTVVGVILDTAIPAGVTPIMALTTIHPTIIRAVVTMAAITAEQITETAIQTAQKCASCNAGLRGADITTVLLMEQWVLKRDKQSGLTSVSNVIDIARPSALIE